MSTPHAASDNNKMRMNAKYLATLPTKSNVVFAVLFFTIVPNLATHLPTSLETTHAAMITTILRILTSVCFATSSS